MTHAIELSDEELTELDQLLNETLNRALVAEHRADTLAYKKYIKQDIALLQRLLKTIQSARVTEHAA